MKYTHACVSDKLICYFVTNFITFWWLTHFCRKIFSSRYMHFLPIFLGWQILSANFFAFWMYVQQLYNVISHQNMLNTNRGIYLRKWGNCANQWKFLTLIFYHFIFNFQEGLVWGSCANQWKSDLWMRLWWNSSAAGKRLSASFCQPSAHNITFVLKS